MNVIYALTSIEKGHIHNSTLARFPDDPSACKVATLLQGAFLLIRKTLGKEWYEKNIKPLLGSEQQDFLHRSLSSEDDILYYQDRVIYLAEFLYVLQGVGGFHQKLIEKREETLEPIYFEYLVAYLLYRGGYQLVFVEETGEKGKTHDLLLKLNDTLVYIEIKCKLEDTSFTDSTLHSSLRRASKQLPKSGPGVIYLKVPSSWTYKEQYKVDHVIDNFLRNNTRVNVVFLYWELWEKHSNIHKRLYYFRPFLNKTPRKYIVGIEDLAKRISNLLPDALHIPVSFISLPH